MRAIGAKFCPHFGKYLSALFVGQLLQLRKWYGEYPMYVRGVSPYINFHLTCEKLKTRSLQRDGVFVTIAILLTDK